jgi:hypothetical protein
MTGPEHYQEAETLLSAAANADRNADHAEVALLLRFAQVHATLAHAAAVGTLDAYSGPVSGYSLGRFQTDAEAWGRVTAGETRNG